MSDRIARVVVVAEDLRSGTLLRRYVERAVSHREVRLVLAPPGRQSAYDWVIEQYPREVADQRHRVSAKGKNNAVLLLHVDADEDPIERRLTQLAESLEAAGEPKRGAKERIAVVVPRRNMETWLHGLCGEPVD